MKYYGDLPVVFLEGSPADRGLAHGQMLGEPIHDYVEKVREVCASQGVLWEQALKKVRRFRAILQDEQPDAFQELEGIARGAEISLDTIVALNAPHELRLNDGCTTIVALPQATQSGHVLIGKNYDEPYQRLKTDALFVVSSGRGPRFVTLASVGTLSRDGFNDCGLVLLGNGLQGPGDGHRRGIPFPILRRQLLAQPSMSAVQRVLETQPRSHACNYTVAFASGEARALEASVDQVYGVPPTDGLLIHTNHFVAPDAAGLNDDRTTEHSRFRLDRVDRLLRPKTGRLLLVDIQNALADHAHYPASVCSHREEGGTIASYWMDLQEGILNIANGPPCKTPITEIPLQDLGLLG